MLVGEHPVTRQRVAVKKIKMPPAEDNPAGGIPLIVLRELRALRALQQHPNVVRLVEVATSKPGPGNLHRGEIFFVFEYAEHDLGGLILTPEFPLLLPTIRSYMAQMLASLAFMHSLGWVHRDLKPGNVLVTSGNMLKMADFGLARSMRVGPALFSRMQVVTPWYRAPELILQDAAACGPAVDVWSLGCMFGEMLRRKPLFPESHNNHLIGAIYKLAGAPDPATWPGLARSQAWQVFKPKKNRPLPQFRTAFGG